MSEVLLGFLQIYFAALRKRVGSWRAFRCHSASAKAPFQYAFPIMINLDSWWQGNNNLRQMEITCVLAEMFLSSNFVFVFDGFTSGPVQKQTKFCVKECFHVTANVLKLILKKTETAKVVWIYGGRNIEQSLCWTNLHDDQSVTVQEREVWKVKRSHKERVGFVWEKCQRQRQNCCTPQSFWININNLFPTVGL